MNELWNRLISTWDTLSPRERGLVGAAGAVLVIFLVVALGALTPVIDRTFPLSEARAAMRRMQAGHGLGKILIAPQAPSRVDPGPAQREGRRAAERAQKGFRSSTENPDNFPPSSL